MTVGAVDAEGHVPHDMISVTASSALSAHSHLALLQKNFRAGQTWISIDASHPADTVGFRWDSELEIPSRWPWKT